LCCREVNDVVNKADRNQSPVLDDILNFLSNEKDQQISSALKTENLRKFLQQLQGLRDAMRKENSGTEYKLKGRNIYLLRELFTITDSRYLMIKYRSRF